jgi:hypothetical protein
MLGNETYGDGKTPGIMYGDVKTPGYNVRGRIIRGLNVRGLNVWGHIIPVPSYALSQHITFSQTQLRNLLQLKSVL